MRISRTTLGTAGASIAALLSFGIAAAPASAASKPPGYVRVNSTPVITPAGAATPASVTCPTGTVVWGGGATFFGGLPPVGNDINTSSPTGTGWRAVYNNRSSIPWEFRVSAICANQPAGYTF